MSETDSRAGTWAIRALIGLVVALAVYLVARDVGDPSAGPIAVEWDREACAECHMHVGDPRFAAQLQTRDGEVLNFDDPGCLFVYLDHAKPAVGSLWFHVGMGDVWLSEQKVQFVPAAQTPMGYGWMASTAATPGAVSLDVARAKTRTAIAKREGP